MNVTGLQRKIGELVSLSDFQNATTRESARKTLGGIVCTLTVLGPMLKVRGRETIRNEVLPLLQRATFEHEDGVHPTPEEWRSFVERLECALA